MTNVLKTLGPMILLAAPVSGVAAEPMIIAHRGASHDAPENTLAAFRLAWRRGADGIEGDFRLTADGQVVCIHDEDTARVAGKKLIVQDSTLAALQELDVGMWKDPRFRGERAPKLRQVIDTVPDGKLLFLEVKCGPEIVEPMAKVLTDSGFSAKQVVIISFNAEVITACKGRIPEFQTQWLTSYKQRAGRWSPTAAKVVATLQQSKADGLGCKAERRCFDAGFVQELADAGFRRFGVWTVNDVATAEFYRSLGAWSITTDRPGWLRERLAK